MSLSLMINTEYPVKMKFEIHQPCDQLKPYIKHFIISENDELKSYKVLPDTSIVMGFQYTGGLAYLKNDLEVPLATAGVTGLMDAYRIFKNKPYTGTVLVVFHEAGAANFFSVPVNELFRESLALDNLFSSSALKDIGDQLSIVADDLSRIKIIEKLLISQLYAHPTDVLVIKALQYIHHSKGTIRITELAKKLHTSQSPLEKRFRRVVGASPKKFASIVRIKNVITALNQNEPEFAMYLAGYYDQAHFIKDFKTFTSQTPEQYLKLPGK